VRIEVGAGETVERALTRAHEQAQEEDGMATDGNRQITETELRDIEIKAERFRDGVAGDIVTMFAACCADLVAEVRRRTHESERLETEIGRLETAVKLCREGREQLFQKAARVSRDWQQAEARLAKVVEAAGRFHDAYHAEWQKSSPTRPKCDCSFSFALAAAQPEEKK